MVALGIWCIDWEKRRSNYVSFKFLGVKNGTTMIGFGSWRCTVYSQSLLPVCMVKKKRKKIQNAKMVKSVLGYGDSKQILKKLL